MQIAYIFICLVNNDSVLSCHFTLKTRIRWTQRNTAKNKSFSFNSLKNMSEVPKVDDESRNQDVAALAVGRDLKAKNVVAVVSTGGSPINVQFPSSKPLSEPIWFGVQDPMKSFIGRETFLTNLAKTVEENRKEGKNVTIISSSDTKILGGQGKTEAIRKFININKKSFFNVIWIDAGNRTRAKDSFTRLAETKLKISLVDQEKKAKSFHLILQEIYERLFKQKCLIVFDNVNDSMLERSSTASGDANNNNGNNGIYSFLPTDSRPNNELSVIIIYSNLLNQSCPMKFQSAVNFQLDNFSTKESIKLLKRELSITLNLTDENEKLVIEKFVELFGGNPLILKYATSFIEQQAKQSPWEEYGIQNFIQDYEDFLNSFKKSAIAAPVYVNLLNLTRKKIQENYGGVGNLALDIMDVLAFLLAEKIPKELLLAMFPDMTQVNYMEAIDILTGYSIIKESNTHFHYEVHQMTQETVLQNMETGLTKINLLRKIIINLQIFLQSKTPKGCLHYRDFVLNALSVMHHAKRISAYSTVRNFINDDDTFLNFSTFMAGVMKSQFDQEEWVQVFRDINEFQVNNYGEESEQATDVKDRLAFALAEQGNYMEGGRLFMDVVKNRLGTIGWNDPVSFGVKLLETGRDILGPSHPDAALINMGLDFVGMINGTRSDVNNSRSGNFEQRTTPKQAKPQGQGSSKQVKDELNLD